MKKLGKIVAVDFGKNKDPEFAYFGLHLEISCGGHVYTVSRGTWGFNSSDEFLDYLNDILNNAKVNYVTELVDVPVEVTVDDRLTDVVLDWRILAEVL